MRNLLSIGFCLILSVCMSSCVKDIDFNQMDDITLNPNMDLALVKYRINSHQVMEAIINKNGKLIDTVSLGLLEESDFRDMLEQAKVEINVFNSLSCNVNYALHFLDDGNKEVLSFNNKIVGSKDLKVESDQSIWNISNNDSLQVFKKARKVVVEFVPEENDTIGGEFYFGSNASFSLGL